MFPRSFVFQSFLRRCSRGSFQSIYLHSRPLSPRSLSEAFRYANSITSRVASRPKSSSRLSIPDPTEETLKFAGRRPAGLGQLERKVAKLGSVVLFEAPSHRGYILWAYGIAAYAFVFAIYNSHIVFRDPKRPVTTWVKVLWGSLCVLTSMMGTVAITRTFRLIKTVKAVHVNGATYLRFSVRRMLPFSKSWQFDVLPRQVAFSRQLVIDPSRVTADGQVMSYSQKPNISFFRNPLKMISYFFFRNFLVVRQLFTMEDFILLEVQGQKGWFKMDANGFVSNDMLLVGNPVRVKYS